MPALLTLADLMISSTMTSKQRVLTAFEHKEPDRVPCWCGSSPEFWDKAKRELSLDDEGLLQRFGDDFRRVFARYAGPEFPLSPEASCRTPFGDERSEKQSRRLTYDEGLASIYFTI